MFRDSAGLLEVEEGERTKRRDRDQPTDRPTAQKKKQRRQRHDQRNKSAAAFDLVVSLGGGRFSWGLEMVLRAAVTRAEVRPPEVPQPRLGKRRRT